MRNPTSTEIGSTRPLRITGLAARLNMPLRLTVRHRAGWRLIDRMSRPAVAALWCGVYGLRCLTALRFLDGGVFIILARWSVTRSPELAGDFALADADGLAAEFAEGAADGADGNAVGVGFSWAFRAVTGAGCAGGGEFAR